MTYRPALDGVRAVAILAVMTFHADGNWLPGGHLGVSVFFVLSGYLITSLLLAEHGQLGQVDLKTFYRRRAARLIPALLPLVATATLFLVVRYGTREAGPEIKAEALAASFFFMNLKMFISGRFPTDPLVPMWSLSLEEQFYIGWPLLLAALLRRARRAVLPLILAAIFIVMLLRWHGVHAGWSQAHLYVGTESRADGLLMGCLVAVLLREREVRIPVPAVAAAALLLGWLLATAGPSANSLFCGSYLWPSSVRLC